MNMKKIIYLLGMILFFTLGITSCIDVVDRKDLEHLTADDVWQDPSLLKGFMDEVISQTVPGWGAYGNGTWTHSTDEGYGMYNTEYLYDNLNVNTVNPVWHYGIIRNVNKFLDNVDLCPTSKLTESLRNQYVAQMLFARAWLYFDMVRYYGGVPLLLHEQAYGVDDLNVERAKTSECSAQIIQDLDAAIAFGDDFPMKWTGNEAGRISRAAAIALKGRILLYYASPQFTKETPGGTKPVAQRWQEAYDATKAAKDQLAAAGYGLMNPNPANFEDAKKTYTDIFFKEIDNPENTEAIWVKRYFYPNYTTDGDQSQRDADANLEFANAFLNADGTPYTGIIAPAGGEAGFSSGITTAPFWIGREPRFYVSVAYNGSNYPLYRNGSSAVNEDATGRMTYHWNFWGGQAPYRDNTRTENGGMQMRKMVDDAQKYHLAEGNRCGTDWILIRYAEVLLNYAEAAAKTGHEPDAIQVLKDIRKRAGIPSGDGNYGLSAGLTGDALILAIVKERQIELACEQFRIHDLRRWRLYTDELAGWKLNGIKRHTIKAKPKEGVELTDELLAAQDINANPDSYFDLFENHIYTVDGSAIGVSERQYFYPIAYETHIRKNPKLQQTNGWDGGTFNPYE
jgi:hypothetical protein